jgi:hypothetical protein|tara:strand:+ start:224 stop:559 length:336 start_codon:yes stop_codon:yes gene_type:complete
MANFAKIENGVVTNIFIAEQEEVDKGTFGDASTIKEWKRDGSIRANPAIISGTYDSSKDKFYWPQPHASWTLDSNDQWVPPITKPTDKTKHWYWDEAVYQADNTKGWVEGV